MCFGCSLTLRVQICVYQVCVHTVSQLSLPHSDPGGHTEEVPESGDVHLLLPEPLYLVPLDGHRGRLPGDLPVLPERPPPLPTQAGLNVTHTHTLKHTSQVHALMSSILWSMHGINSPFLPKLFLLTYLNVRILYVFYSLYLSSCHHQLVYLRWETPNGM